MDLPETMAKAPKSTSRLAFLSRGRSSREPAPAPAPEPAPALSHHESTTAHAEQETFDQTLRPAPAARGRFDKAEPTIEDGEDLDVPTFMRRQS
jgi:cell division protein FtsZ